MERVPTSAIVNNGQVESFLESVYSKAMDVLEANMKKVACSSGNFVAPADNTQNVDLFLKEVTRRAICIFSHKLSNLVSSGHFQFGLLREKNVRQTPPMVCLFMHDGNDGSLLNIETREDIQSRWPVTSDDNCNNKCEGSINTQYMQRAASGETYPKVEAIHGFDKTIESPTDPGTNSLSGKDKVAMVLVSVSHPNNGSCVEINESEMSDLQVQEPTPEEDEGTDICEFTGFHPARNLLQAGVGEKHVDPCAMQQFDNNISESAKSHVNVPSETGFDTNCSEGLEDEGLEDYLSEKFSQQAISDGSVVDGEEGLEICSEMFEECSSIARERKAYKDQEVPNSHLVNPEEVEESSLFYSLGEIKDGDEVSQDVEQFSSGAEVLGCHWFTSPSKGTSDMTSSKGNFQKLPSIPVCNRRRRVGLSRKQKVPPLHTKRLKLSEQ